MGCCQSLNPKTQQPRTIRRINQTQGGNSQSRQEQGGVNGKAQQESGKNNQKGQGAKKNRPDDNDFDKLDEISFVIVDGNNVPQDMAKIVLNTDNNRNYKLPSARNSSGRNSFVSNSDLPLIPLPSQLKNHQEILQLIVNGDTQGTEEMIKKLKIKEIVGIRGLSLQIDDIEFERDIVDTSMWNPLHFAVYYQNLDLVKFILKELKVNVGLTLPKAKAETERDAVNNDKFPEDKILLLLLAYDRRNPIMLKYLLDECFKFWPKNTVETLLQEKIGDEIMSSQETPQHQQSVGNMIMSWVLMISVILRSRTAHAFYGSLSFKKRSQWLCNFAYDLDKYKFKEIKQAYQQEFAMQPYAGMFLFFLLFEDQSEDHELVQRVLENVTDFDYILYLYIEQIDDPSEYFDANRILKLKDKLSPEVGHIMEKVIVKFKHICRELNPAEMIKQSNIMMLELANQPKTTKQDFQDMIDQLKQYNYLVQLQILQVKGYTEQVKLMRNFSTFDQIQLYQRNSNVNGINNDDCEDLTEKWNPVTFAIYHGNLELAKFLISTCVCNTKKLLKVPGLFNTQLVNRLFPFIVSLQTENQEMFLYFWEELGYLWNEDTLDNIFKLLSKKDLEDYIPIVFRSRTTHTIFEAMSYLYKFSFIEHLLQSKHDLLEEINQLVLQSDNDQNGGDNEEFLFEKKNSIDHFFMKVYEALSQQPYSLHFYLSFSKDLIRSTEQNYQDECIDILRKTQKIIKDSDIEVFLHHKPEVALQIVNDLIDEPNINMMSGNMSSGMGPGGNGGHNNMNISNAIDKETKNLALRIKKCPNFKHYKSLKGGQKLMQNNL